MEIPIPEIKHILGDKAGLKDFYLLLQRRLESRIPNLESKYPLPNVEDPNSIEAHIILRLIQQCNTIGKTCMILQDTASAFTLCRSLLDSFCSLKQVYFCDNPEERIFRHYLYLLDGFSIWHKVLTNEVHNHGQIPAELAQQILHDAESMKSQLESCIDLCKKSIKQHPYYSRYQSFCDHAITETAWQYKSFELNPKGRKKVRTYSWKDLYRMLDSRKIISDTYSDFFSQFVHGLAVCSLFDTGNNDKSQMILSTIVRIQYLIEEQLSTIL